MTTTLKDRKEEFKKECKLINLRYEYGEAFTGIEQWAIITDLTEKELLDKYIDEVKEHTPYILLTEEQGKAIAVYRQNDDKFNKRNIRSGELFGYDDETTSIHHFEIVKPDFITEQELKEYELNRYYKKMELIDIALASLTEKQRKYVIARFISNKSAREIAREEGVAHQVIDRHLIAAIKKFEKVFKDFYNTINKV